MKRKGKVNPFKSSYGPKQSYISASEAIDDEKKNSEIRFETRKEVFRKILSNESSENDASLKYILAAL